MGYAHSGLVRPGHGVAFPAVATICAGALDFSTGRLVLATIELIARELGTTTAIITHNAPVAAIADRVLTLTDGMIQSDVRNRVRTPASEIRW